MAILIVIGIIAGIGYYLSLRIHPLTKCKVCGGSGRQDRLGVRLFLGGTGGTGVFAKR